MSWFTKNTVDFFSRRAGALWNSLTAKWDDQSVNWDGIGTSTWYSKNESNWYD